MIDENPEIASDDTLEDSLGRGLDSIFARGSHDKLVSPKFVRLHQQAFRMMVLDAYSDNCTVCHIKHTELLDAAHIIADGLPVVANGLSLCKIHHAAFDSNLLGINYTMLMRKFTPPSRGGDVLKEHDRPMLKHGLQEHHGQLTSQLVDKIILPSHKSDWPDRERLEVRFGEFRR